MRNLFFALIITLTSNFAIAQLSVSNNAYVFVDGTGFNSVPTVAPLFVTNDVNLGSTGNIYLRNDAQLLQGGGNNNNTGTGRLSVYQEGTVDNYAYNHWSSPVGEVTANSTGNRSFDITTSAGIMNEATSLLGRTPAIIGTTYDGSASPLTISYRWLYSYSPGTVYADWDYIGSGTPVGPGYGFSMKGSVGSTSQRYDFAGKPHSGDINVSLLPGQFTLSGNPYPSALDSHAFIHDPSNSDDILLGNILIWEHDPNVNSHNLTDYIGGYASYTISADESTETYTPAPFMTLGSDGFPASGPGGSSTDVSKRIRRYIPIGQGFMIEGIPTTGTPGDGVVTFRNSHRRFYKESDADSEFFKTTATNTDTANQTSQNTYNEFVYNADGLQILPQGLGLRRFRLNVDFNDVFTRQLVHNFHPDATPGFDYGLETSNSGPAAIDAYFVDDEMAYIAQAHDYDINLKIPLVITVDANSPIRVRIYDVQQFNDEPIYLHDKVAGVYYNLRAINFDTNLPAGTYTDRFEITFKKDTTLTADEFTDANFTVFQNNGLSQLVVMNPKSLTVKSVSLTDISGKQIFNKVNLSNQTRYEFPTKNLSDGVYIATILLENNNTLSKKVVVSNK